MRGKKTYLFAIAIGALTAFKAMGWIDHAVYDVLLGLFGAGGLAALRAGVNKASCG